MLERIDHRLLLKSKTESLTVLRCYYVYQTRIKVCDCLWGKLLPIYLSSHYKFKLSLGPTYKVGVDSPKILPNYPYFYEVSSNPFLAIIMHFVITIVYKPINVFNIFFYDNLYFN